VTSSPDQRSTPSGRDASSAARRVHRCVCPGSYDPVTSGHLDIVWRAAELFDEVIIAVVANPTKTGLFTPHERTELILASLEGAQRIRVEEVSQGLLVDYCRRVGAVTVVKGLRSGTDFGYELPMALMNRHLSGLETLFLPASPRYEHISSSLVKEVAAMGGDVTGLVPDPVLSPLLDRIGRSD
jgi:pantetheine-phosphate adenylyltransferase